MRLSGSWKGNQGYGGLLHLASLKRFFVGPPKVTSRIASLLKKENDYVASLLFLASLLEMP